MEYTSPLLARRAGWRLRLARPPAALCLSSGFSSSAACGGGRAMPSASSVAEAAVRLSGRVQRTPVLRSEALDREAGCSLFFKAEHLQATGSFKLRGALNAVLALSEERAQAGVAAHSSGNHAAAVAAAAAGRGLRCTIVVPEGTPVAKQENARAFGAKVVVCAPTQRARRETVIEEAQRMGGAAIIHPYEDPLVIAGQGTMALELLEQCPGLDAIVVPTSGGGMITGVALAAATRGIRVFAAEPRGKRLAEAFAMGQRVLDPAAAERPIDTIADAIRTQPLGETAWALRHLVQPLVLSVGDAQLREAMTAMASHLRQVVEPAGALALAAVLSPAFAAERQNCERLGQPIRTVAAIVCGGNIELSEWARLVGVGAQ